MSKVNDQGVFILYSCVFLRKEGTCFKNAPIIWIDKSKLLRNLEINCQVREDSGAKSLLALSALPPCGVFDLMLSVQWMAQSSFSSLN